MSCGGIGMCGKRPDCLDRHCEGHPVNTDDFRAFLHRLSPEDIGVEAADAPRVTGLEPPIVTTELRPVRWAIDWQGVVIYGGVAVCMFALAWLSTADPRDLSSFWPRVLAALSF